MKKSLFLVLCLICMISGKSFADVGDTLSYCGNAALSTRIGVNNTTSTVYWGIMLPAAQLSGHDSVQSVLLYVTPTDAGTYTLYLYQGGTSSPQTLVYTKTYQINPSVAGWQHCALDSSVVIPSNTNLWVVFANTDVLYPAAACAYVNNVNSNWLSLDGTSWTHADTQVGLPQSYSWLIKCVTHTSATAAPVVVAHGPTMGVTGSPLTFTADASSGATVSWQLAGGTPTTASGMSVTATWNTPGTYNVIATATNANGTSRDTIVLNVFECQEVVSFPYTMGFESTDPLACWTIVDADGDGYAWDAAVFSGDAANNGSGCIASASYINGPGALTPDNWLISPQIYLPQDNGFTLSWYDGAVDQNYYEEHYGVYISTTGTATSDFSLLQEYDITGTAWTQKSIDLSSYAGQHVYIAFRHFDITDMYWMKIDDITITMQQPSTYLVSFECEGNFAGKVDTLASGNNPSLCGQQVSLSSQHTTPIYITCQKFEFDLDALYVNGVDRKGDAQFIPGDVQNVYMYNFQPTEPTTIRVLFVGREMTVTVIANPTQGGSVTGGGTYHYLDTATLVATANSGYTFTGWNDGNTDNPRQIVVTANTTYTANFATSQSIDEVLATSVRLTPNPASSFVELSLEGISESVTVSIVDLCGRTVVSVTDADGGGKTRLDVSSLPAGPYFVRVSGIGVNNVYRLLKK